jgi:hypothetical protein
MLAQYAEGEQALYTWVCMAHYPQVPQEEIPAKICQGPTPISAEAFRGQKAKGREVVG